MVSRSAPLVGILAAFAGIYLIWGTTYLAIALAIQTLPPFVSSCMRFLLAGVLLLGWLCSRQRHPFRGLPVLQAVLCGVLMAGIGNGFVVWAQQGVPSGIAALMVAATPVVVLLLDWLAFAKRTPGLRALVGTVTALSGVAIIIVASRSVSGDIRPVYLLALVGSVLGWSIGTLLQKRVIRAHYVLAFTCVQMFAGASFHALLALLDGEWNRLDPAAVSATSMGAVVYLTVFGSMVATTCYLWLLAHVSAHKVTTYALVNPVVALFLGALVLNEQITPTVMFAGALVLAGIAFVLFDDRAPRRRRVTVALDSAGSVAPP
jgi:drug/metabolite transporter (DMT)-like permease